ncbi:MAG: hypothetical protein ACMXYL_00975 [Candidatus Woesearchaeota archaeon]
MEKKRTGKGKEASWEEIGSAIGSKIEKEFKDEGLKCCKMKANVSADGMSSAIYGLGFLGAAIYYISTATSFWMGVLGVLKALLWPGFLVYELLRMLGA